MTRQSDPSNVQTIPSPLAPAPATGQEVYAYFGCWLDLNQGTARFPINPSTQTHPDGPYPTSAIQSIPALIMSDHACLVAEVSYDPDPIPGRRECVDVGQDRTAQSLVGGGDNPGPKEGHLIPTLFDLRFTSPEVAQNALPDELMIEWGNTPAGSVASIYWPQLNADHVLQLANRFYTFNKLGKTDAHTIQVTTGSITDIPIPRAAGQTLPD